MNDRVQTVGDTVPAPEAESLPERLEMVTRVARRLFRAPIAEISVLVF